MECNLPNSVLVKMRRLALVVLSLVGCCSAYLINVPTVNIASQPSIAPLGWVHIQKMLLPLFENVCEESTNSAIVYLAKDFSLDASNGDYTKVDVIENLRNLKAGTGLLPKGEIFSEYNTDHVKELRILYEVFYYAKDFDTFYKAAAWARQNVNCGLFVDAIYLAVINRKDTTKVSIPAPYELLPNYFVNKDVLVRASFLLTADQITPTSEVDLKVEGNSYILEANYTADIEDTDEDAKLAYYREDIGLNSFYLLLKLRKAPWFHSPNVMDSMYGEHMFMTLKQLAARYDLERYSHGLPELEGYNWESTTPYDPMLIYSNGNDFDHRTFSRHFGDNEDIVFLKNIENNIASVVSHLIQAGHKKQQILSHLMEIMVTSDRSYETLCRKILGFDGGVAERNYSILEHYMTSLRDPLFWKVNKKIVQLVNDAMKILSSYSRNELYFPGVEVLSIETKKMMTNFDNFQFDVTDALKTSTANTTFQVKMEQPRLNHKPFAIKLNISSLVSKKGYVKIFIGPKMMPGELAVKKHLFCLLDSFEVNLKKGYNVLTRSSQDMTTFADDFISLRALRKKVEDAEFGLDALPSKTVESQIGYPSRLLLPKGLSNGLPLQLFVFVAPLTKGMSSTSGTELNTAILSLGYPLDLPIEIKQLFGLPNSLVREITVTHKTETAKPGNGGRPGVGSRPGGGGRPGFNDFNQGDDFYESSFTTRGDNFNGYNHATNVNTDTFYDDQFAVHGLLGDRPDFTYKKTDTNNYAEKKNQYRKKEDYSTKTIHYDPKVECNLPTEIDYSKIIPVTEININTVDALPVHGLLGNRPAFTYKTKDTTDFTNKRTQYKKKEDYLPKIKDETHTSQIDNANKYDNSQNNVANNDILINGPSVSHGLLGNMMEIDTIKYDSDLVDKTQQNIKKEEERTLKREQKKEKYIAKGEQKKDEYIAKRERKIDEHLMKREKQLKDLIKKGILVLEEDVDNTPKENKYRKLDKSLIETDLVSNEKVNEMPVDMIERNNILSTVMTPRTLLASKSYSKSIKDQLDYETKTYQYKKKVEEYKPTKIQNSKKVEYREDTVKTVKNKINNTVGDDRPSSKYIDDIVNIKADQKSERLDTQQINAKGDSRSNDVMAIFESNNLQQAVADDIILVTDKSVKQGFKTNKEITKNINKVPNPTKMSDDIIQTKKDVVKIFENKEIHKNIADDVKNKNIQIDKSTVTEKDLTVNSPVPETDKILDGTNEKSAELNSFSIYEPVITTEMAKTKKRFSVYDFLFNPPVYDDDDDVNTYE